EDANRSGGGEGPRPQNNRQEMKELIGHVGSGTVPSGIFCSQPYFGEIDQQMDNRERGDHQVRAQREEGTAQGETGDGGHGKIVDEAVQAVGGEMPAPFLFDETVRLKEEIGEQMTQVDRQKGAKEELHDFV